MLGNNYLVIIEGGNIRSYFLDDRKMWNIGRPSPGNMPDVRLYTPTISRRHGSLLNEDGFWYYLDGNGKNGTFYRGNVKNGTVDKGVPITSGIHGRIKPFPLKDGDIFIFGSGKKNVINCKTVMALFTTCPSAAEWRVEDTKGFNQLIITDKDNMTRLENPCKGTVIERENTVVIYMGSVTYISGSTSVTGIV